MDLKMLSFISKYLCPAEIYFVLGQLLVSAVCSRQNLNFLYQLAVGTDHKN